MTVLDRCTFDEAAQIAAEVAIWEPQLAAQLLATFRERWRHHAYHWDRAEGEDRVGDAWMALIAAWEALATQPPTS